MAARTGGGAGREERYQPSLPTTVVCLLLLTLAVLGLRARGIDFSLPHATHADARVMVDQIAALRAGEADPEGHRLYPHLMPRIAALFSEPGEESIPPTATGSEHRARASGATLRARWTSVGLSLPLVLLTYLLARLFLGRGGSLFAAALTGTSLLQLSFAQQARPHAALATTTALAVLAAVWLRRRPSLGLYAVAGGAAALAVGSLHSGLAVLPAGLAAHLLRRRPDSAGLRGMASSVLPLTIPLALVAAAVVGFYPFHFQGPAPDAAGSGPVEVDAVRAAPALVEQGEDQVLNLSGHLVKLEAFDGSGFAEVLGALYSYDPLLLVLLALGLLSFALRPPRWSHPDGLVLAAFALPYLIAIGLYGKTPERFVMPLTPFAAIVAARGARIFAPRRAELAWGLALLLLAVPALLGWKLTSLRAARDTYGHAAVFLAGHLDFDDRVALLLDPHQDLPLIQTGEAAAHNAAWPWASRWATYLHRQTALPPGYDLRVADTPGRRPADLARDPLDYLAEMGATHAVVELAGPGPRGRTQRAVHDALVAHAERLHRVSPLTEDDGGNERLFVRSVSFKRPMFRRILESRCTGPTLEVFRLEGPAR